MTTPDFDLSIILYVENPARSSGFYEKLFERPPSESFPNYVAFTFESGLILGLCGRGQRETFPATRAEGRRSSSVAVEKPSGGHRDCRLAEPTCVVGSRFDHDRSSSIEQSCSTNRRWILEGAVTDELVPPKEKVGHSQ
jgi:hypothetical protein